jgi:hypothetical protein
MSTCGTFSVDKDPQADLDYRFEWELWLDGDTISTSDWAVQSGSGFTMHDDSIDGTDTIIWLEGGNVADVRWRVTNTITTAAGRVEERSLMVQVKER